VHELALANGHRKNNDKYLGRRIDLAARAEPRPYF
jgi:hypothetical protein